MSLLDNLLSAGVPQPVLDALKAKFGDGLMAELKANGLKAVAAKAGLDVSSLPDIGNLTGMLDSDGDGKLEMSDLTGAAKNLTGVAEGLADKVGLGGAVDAAKNMVAEARGIDADGDGKTGVAEALSEAKELASSDLGKKVMGAATGAVGQSGGLLSKIKSFFGA